MVGEALKAGPTRRGFVNWLLGTSAVAFLISVLYPVSRYLIPPPDGGVHGGHRHASREGE